MVQETGYLQTLVQKMAWSSARTTVLAQNLARADMPGQKAHDITPFKELVEKGKTQKKDQKYGVDNRDRFLKSINEKSILKTNTNLTGNSIIADEEMQKMNDTATMFMQGANTYQRLVSLYRSVLKGGSS